MKNHLITLCFAATLTCGAMAADPDRYTIDLTRKVNAPYSGHLKFGTAISPEGNELTANSYYFIRNGKPWFPVMGEMHFSRFPARHWEESIIKMKASGVDVLATYIFWNYHEEAEGEFDWSGDRDLRRLAELCKKHEMFLFLRVGPWCHGEVRYGGLPDWVMQLEGGVRKDNPVYLKYVDRYFSQIHQQVKGFYFKEGGTIIGCQIENEFRFNSEAGLKHILNLKQMAVSAGIDVPYYTATGWPGSNQEQTELIPVWGAYPEAPWSSSTKILPLSANYLFGKLSNDPLIGSDLLGGEQGDVETQGYQYPFATAEMGGGNQITYHRRPIIVSEDVVAQAYTKIGSGANLMGYYMYHGGSNKIGKYTTLQESRATKYPNDYPILNYDFYSPLGEWGQIRPSYRDFKLLHSFLNHYGDRLAVTYPFFPDQLCTLPSTTDTLRLAVRSDGNKGFIFINNYQRQLQMQDIEGVTFRLQQADGNLLEFPSSPVNVPKNTQAILPFGFEMEGVELQYATAQPLGWLNRKGEKIHLFFSPFADVTELCFKPDGIEAIKVNAKEVQGYKVVLNAAEEQEVEITRKDGKRINILVMTRRSARNGYIVGNSDNQYLCISSDEVIDNRGEIRIKRSDRADIGFFIYPSPGKAIDLPDCVKEEWTGPSTLYRASLPEVRPELSFEAVNDPENYVNKVDLLPEDDRRQEVPETMPGPQYFVNFKPSAGSSYWKINLSGYTHEYAPTALLEVDYVGDTGSLYAGGVLVADDYYAGFPLRFALDRLDPGQNELFMQVVPFRQDLTVFMEEEVRNALTGDNIARLNGVRILPQYEVVFRLDE